MGKIKNKWIEQQEDVIDDVIDPAEWDAAFPEDGIVEYIDRIAEEHDAYMNQSCEFDW